jgi:hypothetical protein
MPLTGLNIATMNAAIATYATAGTYDLTATPPLKNAGAVWEVLDYDASLNPTRVAEMPEDKDYADIEIGTLRFNGKMSTKVLLGFRACCKWVVATLYTDGSIYMDGLEINDASDPVISFRTSSRYKGLKMGVMKHSSENGDDENVHNNQFVIKGRTPHQGYLYTGTWASLA